MSVETAHLDGIEGEADDRVLEVREQARYGRHPDHLAQAVQRTPAAVREPRPDLRSLLRDVRRPDQNVVCEALDRIASDPQDVACLGKKLTFSRARPHTDAKSMLRAIFLFQLQQKMLRGMQAVVLADRLAGGPAYGDRRVNRSDDEGQSVAGRLGLDGTQAAIMQRIVEEFASGRFAREVAKRLNVWVGPNGARIPIRIAGSAVPPAGRERTGADRRPQPAVRWGRSRRSRYGRNRQAGGQHARRRREPRRGKDARAAGK